jgi:DNA-binding CsgD family transcriptional regulator
MIASNWLIMRGVFPEVWSHRVKTRKQIIGRSPECAIQVLDEKVSRRHAKIWERSGVVFIRDLNSRNGTYVDGERVTRCTVVSGKSVRIGDVTFEVVASLTTARNVTLARISSPTVEEEVFTHALDVPLAGLSDGQRHVLRLLVQGASEKQAAAALGLSYHTIHTHVKQIYRQLQVRSRGELMALCLSQHGGDGGGRPADEIQTVGD